MPYILKGTKNLMDYWRSLGRPCERRSVAAALKTPIINFESKGREEASLTIQYGEIEAQNLAAALGVQVSDVTTNGGQILI